jgi:predicted DNA-binding WGR domain protein
MSICLHRIDQTHNMRRFYWLDVGEREGGAGAVGGLK